MIRKAIALLFLASACYADQVAVSSFKYLNSNENSVIIDPAQAQDLLNVDITPGGKSVKKRSGYGLYKTLSTSQAMHGGFHFFDAAGNDIQLWTSSTSVYGIVADGTPAQIVSSATLNSTLDCADTQGSAYCVDSSRDFYIKTNGTSLTSWATTPIGTMIEATPDRLVVAGVANTPNTLYVSQSNTFTNYVTGPLTTDAFTEIIAAPGSHLTHIRWGCQKLLWWKDASFGYFDFQDQYTAQVKIVSDNIGTFDNTSAIDPGGSVWFRGQDGHIWQYDCSGLLKQTIDISPQIQGSGRRTTNFFTQSSQSEWQTGASSPTNSLSTSISPGDVVTSSFSVTENSSVSGWGNGTASNLVIGVSSISLATNNSGTATNPDFESSFSGNWTATGNGSFAFAQRTSLGTPCSITPQTGSSFAGNAVGTTGFTFAFEALDVNDTVLQSVNIADTNNCVWTQYTLSPSASNLGKRVKFRVHDFTTGVPGDEYLTTTDSYIWGGNITLYGTTTHGASNIFAGVDNIQNGSSTITSGNFTSRAFNSGMPYSFNFSSATWSVNTTTPSFVLQISSSSTGKWADVTSSTGQNKNSDGGYYRYLSTFTITGADSAQSALTGVQIIARSSGTYFSAWKNAPNITAWNTFNPSYSDGDGANNFFIRSSTSPFTVLNSTPNWTAQPANSLVAASTGTYFQLIDSFTITSATGTTPTLNDFTINWYEGSATDQAYLLYFDNSIWASVAYGVGVSSNTYIFRRDLINDGWTLYNFGAGGILAENSHLYFGDVASTGKIFQFGSGTSDNGNSITSYWRSRSFTGADPFLQNSIGNIDIFAKQNSGQSITSTYTMDTSTTSTSYSINLSTTTANIIQSRKLIPSGKNGYTFDLKLGDTSTASAWEILGFRIGYIQLPYRPTQ